MDANCSNTKGSFYCTCHMGYSGDGVVCLGRSFLSRFGPPFTNLRTIYIFWLSPPFSFTKISMNVTHLDYHLSIKTWLTFVMMMLTVQTQKDLTTAHAWTDTLVQGNTVQVKLHTRLCFQQDSKVPIYWIAQVSGNGFLFYSIFLR